MEPLVVTLGEHEHDAFIDALLGIANANTLLMQTMSDEEAGHHIMWIIENHDIVWAIWPDAKAPYGLGTKLISDRFGLGMGQPEAMVPINAIACPDRESAEQIVALIERSKAGALN